MTKYYEQKDGETVEITGQPLLDLLERNALVSSPEELASTRLSELEIEITALASEKVNGHIDPIEKAHWMGVADAIARKQALWLGDQIGGSPDPATYPPLTSDEKILWSNLAIIQKLTESVRDAATAIVTGLYQMTSEEILALPDDWTANHILWP